MFLTSLAISLMVEPVPSGIYRRDNLGRNVPITEPQELRYLEVIELTFEQARGSSPEELAALLLVGREHEPIVDKDLLRGTWGGLEDIRLIEAGRPFADGYCTRSSYTIVMDNQGEIPRAKRRSQERWLKRAESCDGSSGWTRIAPLLPLERGVDIIDALHRLQEEALAGRASFAVQCEELGRRGACGDDAMAAFADLDLSSLRMLDAPARRETCFRGELPDTPARWQLRYCPDEEEEFRLRIMHTPMRPPAPPAPPRG